MIICSTAMRDRILYAYGRCRHGPSAQRCEPVSRPETIVLDCCTFVLDENVPDGPPMGIDTSFFVDRAPTLHARQGWWTR